MQTTRPHPRYAPAFVAILLAAPLVAAAPATAAAGLLDSTDATAMNGALVFAQENAAARDGQAAIVGLSMAQSAPSAEVRASARTVPSRPPGATATARDPSPFGYLEFDWDSGVPGFDDVVTAPARP